jgi:hypothetical protein
VRFIIFHIRSLCLNCKPLRLAILLISLFKAGRSIGQESAFKSLRYDEDYSYLKTDSSSNWYNSLKFRSLSKSKESYLSFGGEVRYQYFSYQNEDWGSDMIDKNDFILTRYLGSVDFHGGSHFRTFIQLQSSLDNGSKLSPTPVDQDILDLHQAFIDVNFSTENDQGFIFRVGRQEMLYGSGRLISVREAPNNRSSFDAAKFIYYKKDFRLDAFYGNYVNAKPGFFDDASNSNTSAWGTYAAFNEVPALHNLDLYYLGIYRTKEVVDDGVGPETRHSIGSRVWFTSPEWLYDVEAVYQFGRFKTGDISAWTISFNVSYTFINTPLTPQLGVKTELISGNRHYNDGKLNTFDAMFPRGAYFGLASLIGPSNLDDIHPYASIAFSSKLRFTSDYDLFYRMSLNDGIYAVNAILIYSGKNAKSRDIGKQLQNELEYTLNKFLYLRADFTWFKAGDYLKEVGPGKDILMASSTIQFKF